MTVASLLGLIGAAIALAIIPGPDTMLALRYALRSRNQGLLAALGSTTSLLVWAILAALGVVAILRASTIAYDLLTIAGGAYIVYLGVMLVIGAVNVLRRVRRSRRGEAVGPSGSAEGASEDRGATAAAGAPERGRRWLDFGGPFLAGALSTITNPKVGIFFLALFPEFVPDGAEWWFVAFVLGGICAAAGLVYLLVLVVVADAMNRWLDRPTVTAVVELCSGTVLAVLGAFVLVPGIVALAAGTAA